MSEVEQPTPPAGEEIHLPGPTIIPLLSAIGITMAVIGTTISVYVSVVGLILVLVTTVIWIRDTRRDVADLPDQHH